MRKIVIIFVVLLMSACTASTGGVYRDYPVNISSYYVDNAFICCTALTIRVRESGDSDAGLILQRYDNNIASTVSLPVRDEKIDELIAFLESQYNLKVVDSKANTKLRLSTGMWRAGTGEIEGKYVTQFIGRNGYFGFKRDELPLLIDALKTLKKKVAPRKSI